MSKYDLVSEDPLELQNGYQRLDRDEYRKKMNEVRKDLFSKIEEQTKVVVSNDKDYLNFLDLQVKLGYTVTNTLLVMSQNPKASNLKEFSYWVEKGASIKKGQKAIKILKPKTEFMRNDGTVGSLLYEIANVFDVSQTKSNEKINKPIYSTYQLVKALTYKASIVPELVTNEVEFKGNYMYDHFKKRLYVRSGLEEKALLKSMLYAYCQIECSFRNWRYQDGFLPESVAYMIGQKFGIDGVDKDFAKKCTKYEFGETSKEMKENLEKIVGVYKDLKEKMEQGLYVQQQQERKRKTPSRTDR